MTTAELKALILADPTAKAHADAGRDAAAAVRATAISVGPLRPVTSAELLVWSGGGAVQPTTKCRLERIREASAGATQHANNLVRGAALVLAAMIVRDDVPLDPKITEHIDMINGLVTASVLNAADRTALQAIAATKAPITPSMVSAAWAEFRPDGKVQ